MFPLGDLSAERFFAEYWRQEPLMIRGGARRVLGPGLNNVTFRAALTRQRAIEPDSVAISKNEGTVFIQRVDRVLPWLNSRLACPREHCGEGLCWFDAIRTEAGQGIGSHYDPSDNFVLQQSGHKVWRLCSATLVPEDERRRRLAGETGIGNFYIPDDRLEFRLGPGDLLYIPLLWPHWGVSEDRSLSVSLVCNPPVGSTRPEPAELGSDGRNSTCRVASAPPPLDLPVDRIRAFVQRPLPPLPLERLVLPSAHNYNRILRDYAARGYARRLFVSIARLRPHLTTVYRERLQQVIDMLAGQTDAQLIELVLRPSWTSWSWRASQAANFAYGPRIDRIVEHLKSLVSPNSDSLRLAESSVSLVRDDPWYREFFPTDSTGRTSPLRLGCGDGEFDAFRRQMEEGSTLLRVVWPEAWAELQDTVQEVAMLPSHGLEPHNATVQTFRGLVTTSGRPGWLAAMSLVHEAGHNKLWSILDVFRLFEDDTQVWQSPWVDQPRPMNALFHAAFAFLQDAYLARRLDGWAAPIGGLSPKAYLEQTVSRLALVIGTIESNVRSTPHGTQLVAGLRAALDILA